MSSSRSLKIAIWAYFWLLILEGVLRKWILPEWSDVLFVIRDPVVAIIYLLAVIDGKFPGRISMNILWLLAIFSLSFAALLNLPVSVTLFGLRTNYLHFPLVFVMAVAFDRNDVIAIGRAMIIAGVPIVALMIVQFNAEPEDWVNVGAGAVEGAQLRGALGKIRPPGPFSFVSGVVSYFALMMAFVVYGWLKRGVYSWLLVLAGSVTIVAATPVSISRSLVFSLAIVMVFGATAAMREMRRLPLYFGPLVLVLTVVGTVADSIYVQAFVTRWKESVQAEEGGVYASVVERVVDLFVQPFEVAADAPLFGHGVGLGTVAGARMATGEYSFLLAESELMRVILELGPILGFAFVAWRAWLAVLIVLRGWRFFWDTHDSLAWLVAGASFVPVLCGQLGPATSLGFTVFGAGLSLAALNDPEPVPEVETDEEPVAEAGSGA